ncbi:MAG: phosphate ABC transporter substrate-binding protein [Coriobacteriia bacterium]|nr:phosphate ABC transporter substrate-binding protein [Coriobacteriia bacterium]
MAANSGTVCCSSCEKEGSHRFSSMPKTLGPLRKLLVFTAMMTVLLLSSFVLTGCTGRDIQGQIIVSGSTTLLPIAETAAQQFEAAHPQYIVLVSGMGTSAGIEAVGVTGTADIGTSSRDLRGAELDLDLIEIPVAYDGIAVIVHPDNPVNNLTLAELRDVFSGNITNWQELGGPDMPIVLVNRDEASGTRSSFASAVMDDESFEVNSVVLPGTGQVREVVARTPEAIGYISVGFVEPRHVETYVQAISLDGVEPTDENIISEEYPISRALHFLVAGTPEGSALEYIEFVLSDEVQQGAVRDAGFLPITEADHTEFRRMLSEGNY